MLSPKKVKYRKQQKGRMRGAAFRGSDLEFGDFRSSSPGMREVDGSTDRSGSYCHDPFYQTGREDLDTHIPR